MSMLQQILDQMFVDPEILEALDEEQKQILFIKMREEQVKRWKAYEEKCEAEISSSAKKNNDGKKRVQWLKGADGEIWVWVMGEHKDDLSIDEIIERRALEEARRLAEKEMLDSIRMTELEESAQSVPFPSEDENTLKQQLSRMCMRSGPTLRGIQESMYEDADAILEPVAARSSPTVPVVENANAAADGSFRVASYGAPRVSNGRVVAEKATGDVPRKVAEGGPPPLPMRPPRLKHLSQKKESPRSSDGVSDRKQQTDVRVAQPVEVPGSRSAVPVVASVVVNTPSRSPASRAFTEPGGDSSFHSNASHDVNSTSSTRSEKEVDVKDISQGFAVKPVAAPSIQPFVVMTSQQAGPSWEQKASTLPAKLSAWQPAPFVKMRAIPAARATNLAGTEDEISKRQSEIYEMIKEKHQKILKEAELEAERERPSWEEQERKAREAEAQIRQIAQKAREQHRQQSLRTSTSILPALRDTNASSLREAIRNLPRPPKPKSRQAIVDWFRMEELQRGTGLDPKTCMPAPWFHGIISREQADVLLRNKPSGSFLVRVSERIWGYTVSYVVNEDNTKHFLIERIPEGYQFLGTNQVVHDHLYDLITYHETAPITLKGNEILKWAVGQTGSPPDYCDLIPETYSSLGGPHSHTLPVSFSRRF